MNNYNFTTIALHENLFEKIISKENLLTSWQEFKLGKSKKSDVKHFELNLAENILDLHYRLKNKSYCHGNYTSFYTNDPKLRHIHKASVSDRILHHAIIRIIEPLFESTFIFDSYSSRKGKGTHKAVLRLKEFAWKLSHNNTKTVWVLKCDIRKFFDSVDHEILLNIIHKRIKDNDLIWLLENIIRSFPPPSQIERERERERKDGLRPSCFREKMRHSFRKSNQSAIFQSLFKSSRSVYKKGFKREILSSLC